MDNHPSLESLQRKLRELMPLLAERYQVESLGIFGSYLRKGQSPESDLDLLVTFHEKPGLIKFIELENFLTDTLDVKVDLVMKDALRPRIGERILEEVISV